MNAGARPVWLDEEVEITALLDAVLDRFDRQPGEARQRQVFFHLWLGQTRTPISRGPWCASWNASAF